MIGINRVWFFVLCALAVWQVAHLLARESGPLNLVARLRATLGSGVLGRMMDCFYCLSFLFSLPLAIWVSNSLMGFLVQWLALSAVVCLLERATQGQHGELRVSPASTSYLDKVLRGV
jgi:cytochrome oxidase assembly protein ShyY1